MRKNEVDMAFECEKCKYFNEDYIYDDEIEDEYQLILCDDGHIDELYSDCKCPYFKEYKPIKYVERDTKCDKCQKLTDCISDGNVILTTIGADTREHYINKIGVMCDMTEKEISKLKEDNFNKDRTIEKFQSDFQKFDEKIKALEAENKELQCVNNEMKHRIDCLEADKIELRSRCKESAIDNFDNHLYGLLNIVSAEELHPKFKLPTEPIRVADTLIYSTEKRINPFTQKEYDGDMYSVSDLRQIAEHLLVYCNNSEE